MSIDLTNHPTQTGPTLVPPGKYLVTCTSAQLKETKAHTGQFIEANLKIKEGEHEGRSLTERWNVINANEKAQAIGLSQLKSFLVKAGATNFVWNSMAEVVESLIAKTCVAVVVVKKDDQWGDRSEVRYFQTKEESIQEATTGFAPGGDTF